MSIIYFILILGITVLIHELGHFIFAKKAGIYCYEFSIGMGPLIKKWKRKNDETEYCLRLFPIGGYVSMAGEGTEDDPKVPKSKKLQNKTWGQRFMTMVAGVMNNFILALVVFFIVALVQGAVLPNAYVGSLEEGMPAFDSGLVAGDEIIKYNGEKVNSDMLLLKLMVDEGEQIRLTVKHEDGTEDNVVMTPKKVEEDGETTYKFGFTMVSKTERGFIPSVCYAFRKLFSLLKQMFFIVFYLCTGKISLTSLSGPVGIYSVVDQTAKTGFINIVYLLGYISANVGFMNILPIPAFDGGHVLFLIIEKIIGRPVSQKVENTIHGLGMVLLMILMVLVTYNDIVNLFFK